MLINLDPAITWRTKVPLKTLLPLAKNAGYDTVQFPLWEITTIEQAKEATREVTDSGLQWSLMPMDIDIMRECPEEVYKADLEALKRHMDLAQAAGVRRYRGGRGRFCGRALGLVDNHDDGDEGRRRDGEVVRSARQDQGDRGRRTAVESLRR